MPLYSKRPDMPYTCEISFATTVFPVPALPNSATVNGDPAALAAWVVLGVRPATSPAGKYRSMMPQFTYLKDEELAAVLTHVRTSWGNTAAPVTVAQIAAVRAAHAAP